MTTPPAPTKPVRITEVRARVVSIPLARPLMVATFRLPAVDTVLVDVRTDTGASGLGWMWAFGAKRVRAMRLLVEDLGDLLIGEDALAIERCWQRMWRSITFIGHSGAAVLAMAPIDTALWEVVG